MKLSHLVLAVTLSLSATSAFSHEFWIEPQKFQVENGEIMEIDLKNGQNFVGAKLSYFEKQFSRFELAQGGVEEIRRKVLRDQLGPEADDLLGAAPEAPTQVKRGFKRRVPHKGEFGGPGQPGLPRARNDDEDNYVPRGKPIKTFRPDKATRDAAKRSTGGGKAPSSSRFGTGGKVFTTGKSKPAASSKGAPKGQRGR